MPQLQALLSHHFLPNVERILWSELGAVMPYCRRVDPVPGLTQLLIVSGGGINRLWGETRQWSY